MNEHVALQREQEISESGAVTPMGMLDRALQSGASLEMIEKLMTLQERWEKNQARKAFDEAMAVAKVELPVINKNREVDFTSPKGRTHYRYEDLAEISKVVGPILGRHGLSYRFRTTSNPNEPVTVTCIVSHRLGYFEENTLSAGRDESGNKNSIQAVGSTLTYLQRMTLKAALGLAATDDDDGRGATVSDEKIAQDQVEWLQTLVVEVGADLPKFFSYLSKQFRTPIGRLEDIPASKYPQVVDALNAKRTKK